jgi:hypothetical protein
MHAKPEFAVSIAYEPDVSPNNPAFLGHYVPSRARVARLIDFALAHEHDPFWEALARRLFACDRGSAWNEAVAAAQEVGRDWTREARVRRIVHAALFEGRLPGHRGESAPAFDA